jgi:hypothetical protein
MFFAREENKKILETFLKNKDTQQDDPVRKTRLDQSKKIISFIYQSPEIWDNRCGFNIRRIGDQFLKSLSDFSPIKFKIDEIYALSYTFLCEYDFLLEEKLDEELQQIIKNEIQFDTNEIDNIRTQIIYASYFMPAHITRQLINNPDIAAFRNFEDKKTDAEKLKLQWDQEIIQKQSEVDRLKDALEEHKTDFNFVGLHKGFSDLGDKKKTEAKWLFWSLIGMGVVIVTPLFFELYLSVSGLIKDQSLGIDHLIVLFPSISVEVILIYFFRIILQNYQSVKAQNLQIDLRKTLCQFIQSYAEYSSEIKKQDSTALEKFESLIFSGVLSDPEKLPSTYDGLDQLGNFIKNIKGS